MATVRIDANAVPWLTEERVRFDYDPSSLTKQVVDLKFDYIEIGQFGVEIYFDSGSYELLNDTLELIAILRYRRTTHFGNIAAFLLSRSSDFDGWEPVVFGIGYFWMNGTDDYPKSHPILEKVQKEERQMANDIVVRDYDRLLLEPFHCQVEDPWPLTARKVEERGYDWYEEKKYLEKLRVMKAAKEELERKEAAKKAVEPHARNRAAAGPA
ncbi:hypothetical protein MMC24_006535 [Lignoscripta atroalba]|nr:hypothetical protein [Lignoscripta atroalba]